LRRACLLTLASCSALFAGIKFGDRPPDIEFDEILPAQPAESLRFETLKGKVVILELWATWCGPCVAAIPHPNDLADQFKDSPVVFLSVTDEEPVVVEAKGDGWIDALRKAGFKVEKARRPVEYLVVTKGAE
jgi:thiol-disulfide isomerase/thioredoxin